MNDFIEREHLKNLVFFFFFYKGSSTWWRYWSSFSIFHLIIRDSNKRFEKFKDFLNGHTNSFKIIVFRETWLKDENENKKKKKRKERKKEKFVNFHTLHQFALQETACVREVLPCLFIIL